MVDASYQAEDSTVKQNLLLALETINELQADYNKVKAEYEWHRRFRSWKIYIWTVYKNT